MFGLPIFRVQDVFVPVGLTRVPLAPPEVAGILNLRGRVVTAIDMRSRLDFGEREPGTPVMAIGIELKGESYGLLVDAVGEVMQLHNSACEAKPANLDPRLSRVAAGIYRLEGQLMVVLDVDRVLDIQNGAVAA
jgi:purine-binding chemotaxis protein CheW